MFHKYADRSFTRAAYASSNSDLLQVLLDDKSDILPVRERGLNSKTEPPSRTPLSPPDVNANNRSHGRGPEQAQLLESRAGVMAVMRAI